MLTNNFFYKCNTKSDLVDYMLNKIKHSKEDDWNNVLEMNLFSLNINDFNLEPKLIQLINEFDCHKKLSLFRYKPNFCYQWHIDSIRNCALNLQIIGSDSFCVFGNFQELRKFNNIQKLHYEPNTYYLLNVSKFHTVFNFDKERYILSIGFPKPIVFDEVKAYLVSNNI